MNTKTALNQLETVLSNHWCNVSQTDIDEVKASLHLSTHKEIVLEEFVERLGIGQYTERLQEETIKDKAIKVSILVALVAYLFPIFFVILAVVLLYLMVNVGGTIVIAALYITMLVLIVRAIYKLANK